MLHCAFLLCLYDCKMKVQTLFHVLCNLYRTRLTRSLEVLVNLGIQLFKLSDRWGCGRFDNAFLGRFDDNLTIKLEVSNFTLYEDMKGATKSENVIVLVSYGLINVTENGTIR